MKTITIEVPQDGTCVQFLFRGAAPSAQAVIVVGDDVEIQQGRLVSETAAVAGSLEVSANAANDTPLPPDLQIIYATLLDQRIKRRTAAVNVIKTMFQFTKPITTQTANKIFDDLCRRGFLTITPTGAVEFPQPGTR